MKHLKRFIVVLVYLLPAVLYCGYHPVIHLGETDSMNLELSLPLIWLVLFDLAAFLALMIRGGKRVWRASKSWQWFFSEISATNGERTKRRPARNDRPGQVCSEKTVVNYLDTLSDRRFFLFSLFPFFATLSIFWSANPTRAILTAGVIWLVFFAVFSLIYVLPLLGLPANFKQNCLRSFLISSAIICLICWLQCLLDIAGLRREATLMCYGCTSVIFGFPHPSGLAIEPQFMGNLLLAPTLTVLYLLIFNREGSKVSNKSCSANCSLKRLSDDNGSRTKRRLTRNDGLSQAGRVMNSWYIYALLATLFSATLFLTFSRGAIYAYAIALAVMLFFALRRHVFRASLVVVPLASFIFVVIIQGVFTVVGPTHGSFASGVSSSIHQLSLGLIDLRSLGSTPVDDSSNESAATPDTNAQNTSEILSENPQDLISGSNDTTPESPDDQPIFTGYVAESTNTRLNLNRAAIDTWLSAPGHAESGLSVGLHCHFFLPGTGPACTVSTPLTPTSVLFGVGLGGAGTAMYRNSFITGITSPKEIVQNQGISLLLELGLVGIALALLGLLIAFFPQIFPRKFLDGKFAIISTPKSASAPASIVTSRDYSPFWRHPALPLLTALILAYLVTLNFFSGLPNALQIYLLPPLLYIVFQAPSAPVSDQIPAKNHKTKSRKPHFARSKR